MKLLSVKYESHYRRFVSGDSEHHILLRDNNVDVCTLISIENLHRKGSNRSNSDSENRRASSRKRQQLPSVFVVFRELSATDANAEDKAVALTHQVIVLQWYSDELNNGPRNIGTNQMLNFY